MQSITQVPAPRNEPVRAYTPGSDEQRALWCRLSELRGAAIELPAYVGGRWQLGGGAEIDVVEPHLHSSVLGTLRDAVHGDASAAVEAARDAAHDWQAMPFDERAAIFLRAAELLSGPWRDTLNAATMLGQSKTAYQAEIDAACELADFWRFNATFARAVLEEQPYAQAPGIWNRLEHRPLEGVVYAISPFNFTAIAGNLPTAPALMGNTAIWKPSPTQQLAAHFTMKLLEESGLPPGVINMLPGTGIEVSEVVLDSEHLAGIHFTGSTATFRMLWRRVTGNLDRYRTYPRLVGETGGKGFVLAHSSADPAEVRTALLRGAFDYQGQKCSAASRAYLPRSLWNRMRDDLADQADALAMGDVVEHTNFLGAVIDERSFDKQAAALARFAADEKFNVLAGGRCERDVGYFVRPTIVECADPEAEVFSTEYFGPILAVHVYEDDEFDSVLRTIDATSPYALTGAVLAHDRGAVDRATTALQHAAGNFYVNDKPTGAVVGQQPFGGSRASGTNDKAGAPDNLRRWTSVRTIKETFVPPRDHRYPHMG